MLNSLDTPQVQLLLAHWIAPIDQPPIRNAAVAFADGRILAVGTATELLPKFPDASRIDLGAATLLPGLVNAHVHLELSKFTPGVRPARFVDWLLRVMSQMSSDPVQAAQFAEESVALGVQQCLRFGVTTVGDISRQCPITRPMLKNGPLRVVSFGEVLAMGARRPLLEERLTVAASQDHQTPSLRAGISPHAPYSIESHGYRRCLETAWQFALPLATHLAETPDEAEFLEFQTGPFRQLWETIGGWDSSVPRFAGGPIRFADTMGLLDYPTLLAHVNYCDDELKLLSAGIASVVYCPRTHAYFGHPPHRWREMLAAGINVAIGTDSTASSPDLNLMDDLRLLHQIAPEIKAETLWEMATIRGAQALQLDQHVGSIAPGKSADFIVYPMPSEKPLTAILESQVLPSTVWINGQQVSGEHVAFA